MMRSILILLFCMLPVFCERPSVTLDSGAAKLTIDLLGGGISGFELAGVAVNPFTWEQKGEQDEARPRGHFLCLDRWGAPSAAETANGMPFHGEASKVLWTVSKRTESEVEMWAELPMAKLRVARRVTLAKGSAIAEVIEQVTNKNPLGRIYNWVQHPSIAPPFLDESTIVNANAVQGFPQSAPLPNPERMTANWPMAYKDNVLVNISRLTNDMNPNVVSYVIDEEFGWTTAATPGQQLLVGYIWKTSDYPWFNAWRNVVNGKPAARGLEFGTTGLHQPFPILAKKAAIYGRPLFAFLDAGESETRSYKMFLAKVPRALKAVMGVSSFGGSMMVKTDGPTLTVR